MFTKIFPEIFEASFQMAFPHSITPIQDVLNEGYNHHLIYPNISKKEKELIIQTNKSFFKEFSKLYNENILLKNKKDSCNPEELIRRINNLNKKENGIYQWIWAFSKKYSELLEYTAADIKRNRHNYLKTCAVNYLVEYNAGVTPGFMDYDYEE